MKPNGKLRSASSDRSIYTLAMGLREQIEGLFLGPNLLRRFAVVENSAPYRFAKIENE